MNLKELVLFANSIESEIIEADGEITPEIEQKMQLSAENLSSKVDGYVTIMQRLTSSVALQKERLKEIDKLINGLEKALERMEASLMGAALELNKEHLNGNQYTVTVGLNPPKVDVINEEAIPEEYKTQKTTVSVNKTKIAESLKLGLEVPGARLTQSKKIRVKARSQLLE